MNVAVLVGVALVFAGSLAVLVWRGWRASLTRTETRDDVYVAAVLAKIDREDLCGRDGGTRGYGAGSPPVGVELPNPPPPYKSYR